VNEFAPAFREWLAASDPSVETSSGARQMCVLLGHGEEKYVLETLPDRWTRVSHLVRGGAPKWEADVLSLEAAQAYLAVRYANAARRRLGLPALDLRERLGEESPRMTSTPSPWLGPDVENRPPRMRVLASGGRDLARFGLAAEGVAVPARAISFAASATWYIDRPLTEVLASLRHPTGAPLFELLGDRRA
jgi:hypothetical protein